MRYPTDYITVTQVFHSSHHGIDFGWNSAHGGAHIPVMAIDDGKVIETIEGYGNTYHDGVKRYGNCVYIQHANNLVSIYGHLKKGTVKVKMGRSVKKGDLLGLMNDSGYSRGNHLHFEIKKNGNKIDPIDYLRVYPGQYVSEQSKIRDRIKYLEEREPVIIKPEVADRMRDQIKVNIDNLNIRSNPYLGDNKIGMLQRGIYNVYEQRDMTHEQSNGYLWYRIADNVWCAQVNGVDFYKAELPEIVHPPATDQLGQEIKELKQKNTEMIADFKAIMELPKKHI